MVLALTCLAFALCLVVGRIEREELDRVSELPTWSPLVLVVGIAALSFFLAPRRLIAWLGLRHPFTYPPYWFGGAIGVGSAAALVARPFASDFRVSTDASVIYWTLAIVAFAAPATVLVLATFRWLFADTTSLLAEAWPSPQTPSLEQFQKWIADDSAIDDPAADLFGHAEIARRMGQRLVTKQPTAQALVGKLGAGKTTVSALVARWLSGRPEGRTIEIVKIELWPYESPRAAVEGILRTIVDAFSNEVSTSQLEGLPAAYGEAIAKIARVSEWLPKIARKEVTPAESLRALDDVATAIGRRYVLWVEDLERFAAGDPNAPARDSELERLAPIRAVLHGLDQLRSITVVTATTDLIRRFDLEKISRYVERIPELKMREARRVISAMRREMLANAGVVDPADPAARARLGWDDGSESDERTELAWLGETIGTFASAVASLATTPRVLKQGLRRAMETWAALLGEIDLDDVIALSLMQEAYPNVFALVEQRAVGLRGGRTTRRNEPSPMDSFRTALGQLELEPRTREAVQLIVDEIFGHEARRRPQGIAHDHHADYLRRFLSTPELGPRDHDQAVLRVLLADDDEKIIDLLVDERSTGVEDFARLIPQQRMDGLIVKLTARHLRADITKWEDHRPPGLVPLWRMLQTKHRNQAQLEALVGSIEQAIDLAAPQNVLLMYELAHWLATSVPDVQDLLPTAELRERINARVRNAFVATFQNRPKEMGDQLRGAPPFLLVWISWTIERVRAKATKGVPFAQWSEFLPTLLEALKVSPATMATQVAGLVVREARRLAGPDEWIFDEEQCGILFGDVDAFVNMLRDATESIEIDPRTAAVLARRTTPSAEQDDDDRDAGDGGADDDQLGGTSRATRALVEEAGIEVRPGGIPGQVDGYWYRSLEEIPARRPESEPAAVLPHKEELGDGSLALFLVEYQGEWAPISEHGDNLVAQALVKGQRQYFVTAADWSAVYAGSLQAAVDADELAGEYDDLAYERARADASTLVIRLDRVVRPSLEERRQPESKGVLPS